VCHGCVLGKHQKDPFPSSQSWQAQAPSELVHTDISGPIPTPSFSSAWYILTFIDDYTRRTWVYFITLKIEVFNLFVAFKPLVENQFRHLMKRIHTDNGRKYVNKKFIEVCSTHDMQMQYNMPYTPQQNDVAKHKNHTLK
jgi:transposase InsO family protein